MILIYLRPFTWSKRITSGCSSGCHLNCNPVNDENSWRTSFAYIFGKELKFDLPTTTGRGIELGRATSSGRPGFFAMVKLTWDSIPGMRFSRGSFEFIVLVQESWTIPCWANSVRLRHRHRWLDGLVQIIYCIAFNQHCGRWLHWCQQFELSKV